MRIKAHEQALLNPRTECAENGIEPSVRDIDQKRRIATYIELAVIAAKVENTTQLAKKANIAPSTLNKFMKNPDKAPYLPTTRTLIAIRDVSGIDYASALDDHASPISDIQITRAPKITWEQAAMLVNPRKSLPFAPGMDSVPMTSESKTLVAIELIDNSMDRLPAPKGSTAIIDYSDKHLRSGEPYAFKLKGGNAVRIYRERPARLEPLSYEAGVETIFPVDKIEVIGHVVTILSNTGKY